MSQIATAAEMYEDYIPIIKMERDSIRTTNTNERKGDVEWQQQNMS